MRRFLFDRHGEMRYYLTGAGVLYDRSSVPIGIVEREQVVSADAQHLGWFDGAFLRDAEGYVVAFVKGAKPQDGLALPPTEPFRVKLEPAPLAFRPLLVPRERPEFHWAWSEKTFAGFGPTWA